MARSSCDEGGLWTVLVVGGVGFAVGQAAGMSQIHESAGLRTRCGFRRPAVSRERPCSAVDLGYVEKYCAIRRFRVCLGGT